jgi:DNA-binding Lrp family transcriptional regulator
MGQILDRKDKKLLFLLSRNARLSNSQLARELRIAKNSVRYRIGRLEKEGLLERFTCTVNLGALGLETFVLLLKFNEDIYASPEILGYFKNHAYSDWVAVLSGDWDILAEFVCKDFQHLKRIVSEITERFGARLACYETIFSFEVLKVEHLPGDLFPEGAYSVKPREFHPVTLDTTDRKLLGLLADSGRLTSVELGEKAGIETDTARYRLKRLLKDGVVSSFFASADLRKLGYSEHLHVLSLRDFSPEEAEALKNRIRASPNTTYAFFDVSSAKLVFSCAFKDPAEMDRFLRSIRKEHGAIISGQDYLLISEQVKFNLFPQGLRS